MEPIGWADRLGANSIKLFLCVNVSAEKCICALIKLYLDTIMKAIVI